MNYTNYLSQYYTEVTHDGGNYYTGKQNGVTMEIQIKDNEVWDREEGNEDWNYCDTM
jgi:hypothetical protein